MPPFRNFLSSRKAPLTNGVPASDENQRPSFEGRPSLTEKRSVPLSLKSSPDELNEFKLCEINDSGVYLPPSPTERPSFWHKSTQSTISSNHRSFLSENEPFSISRESFESYRRSFDISARSPVPSTDSFPSRISLQIDSRPSGNRFPRSAHYKTEATREAQDNEFEDVGLNDETNKPKKRSFLSRFGDSGSAEPTPPSTADGTKPGGHFGFHLSGRKRGQSGVGSELGSIERPDSAKGMKPDAVVR